MRWTSRPVTYLQLMFTFLLTGTTTPTKCFSILTKPQPHLQEPRQRLVSTTYHCVCTRYGTWRFISFVQKWSCLQACYLVRVQVTSDIECFFSTQNNISNILFAQIINVSCAHKLFFSRKIYRVQNPKFNSTNNLFQDISCLQKLSCLPVIIFAQKIHILHVFLLLLCADIVEF